MKEAQIRALHQPSGPLSGREAWHYTLFGLLYFSQGAILGYFTALNALYLLSRGLGMTDVGIFAAIVLLPHILKIFLGMLSDNVPLLGLGHRKPYILIGTGMQALCLLILPFLDPAAYYRGFVALAFVIQIGMALSDTCTDGFAVDVTPPEKQGTVQSFMVGGRALGMLITASLVGWLAEHVSWTAVFWLLAGFTLLPLPLLLTLHEFRHVATAAFDWGAFRAFRRHSVLALSLLGIVIFLVIAGANQNVNPFLQAEFDIPLTVAGYVTTVWALGVVLGGLGGGWLLRRWGDRQTAHVALALVLLTLPLLALTPSPAWIWPFVILFGVAYGTYQTFYFTLAMRHTDPRIAASMFAILMAFTNVGLGAGMALSGTLADLVGFRPTFLILAALNLLALPPLRAIFGLRQNSA